MRLRVHIDGGSRGNPGPAAAGVVIEDADDGVVIFEGGFFLGRLTNNAAEYHALLKALELARRYEPKAVDFLADSELMVHQLNGVYRVKSVKLKPLYERAVAGLNALPRWSIRHMPRSLNARADAVANAAMDRKKDVVALEALGLPGGAGKRSKRSAGQSGEDSDDSEASPSGEAGPSVTGEATPRWSAELGGISRSCAAGTHPGETYVFGPTTPAGFCVHAAAAALADGPLQWPPNRDEGSTRCDLCGFTIRMRRVSPSRP